jgi:hypothetical protein
MAGEKRPMIAGLRKYYEEEIEGMVRQMKIDGGTLEDCVAELHLLADFVRSQADGLKALWPNLLQDTYYEIWEREQNKTSEADTRLPKNDPEQLTNS